MQLIQLQSESYWRISVFKQMATCVNLPHALVKRRGQALILELEPIAQRGDYAATAGDENKL